MSDSPKNRKSLNSNSNTKNIHFFYKEKDVEKDVEKDKDKEKDNDVEKGSETHLDADNIITGSLEDDMDGMDEIINELMQHFFEEEEESHLDYKEQIKDANILSIVHEYDSTYNVKELTKICEFYNISKQINKLKKLELVYLITLFENDGNNAEIVLRRKKLWHYINELKQDKFMKRFIIW